MVSSLLQSIVARASDERMRFCGRVALREQGMYSCYWQSYEYIRSWADVHCLRAGLHRVPGSVVRALHEALPLNLDTNAVSIPGQRVYLLREDRFVSGDCFEAACARQVSTAALDSSLNDGLPRRLNQYLEANGMPLPARKTFIALLGQLLRAPTEASASHTLVARIPPREEWDVVKLLGIMLPLQQWCRIKRPQDTQRSLRKAVRDGKTHLLIDARRWPDRSIRDTLRQIQQQTGFSLHVVLLLAGSAHDLGGCEHNNKLLVPFDLTGVLGGWLHLPNFGSLADEAGDLVVACNRATLAMTAAGGIGLPNTWCDYLTSQRSLLGLHS